MDEERNILHTLTELEGFIIKSKRKAFSKDKIIVNEQELLNYILKLRDEAGSLKRTSSSFVPKEDFPNDENVSENESFDYNDYNDLKQLEMSLEKPKTKLKQRSEPKLEIRPKNSKPKPEIKSEKPKLKPEKSLALNVKPKESSKPRKPASSGRLKQITPSAAERVKIWPYDMPSHDEFFIRKEKVSNVMLELGAQYYDKDTYQYNGMYFRLDEILFKKKPFIVIKYAEDEEDLECELFLDSNPFPYDLTGDELFQTVKSNMEMLINQ